MQFKFVGVKIANGTISVPVHRIKEHYTIKDVPYVVLDDGKRYETTDKHFGMESVEDKIETTIPATPGYFRIATDFKDSKPFAVVLEPIIGWRCGEEPDSHPRPIALGEDAWVSSWAVVHPDGKVTWYYFDVEVFDSVADFTKAARRQQAMDYPPKPNAKLFAEFG